MSRPRPIRATRRAHLVPPVEVLAQPSAETPLSSDYLAGDPALAPFYFGHPHDAAAYIRKSAEVAARFDDARRRALAPALRPVSDAAAAKLESVVREAGFIVTTGQQAGLFTGPLYTIYKALTAVRLAATLEPRLGRPVLPVFWIAAEDHDWDEIAQAALPGPDDRPARITLARPPDARPVSMARQLLGAGVEPALRALEAVLPHGPERAAVLDAARAAYRPDRTVADAFRALFETLLAPFPLCTISAADPTLKRLSAPLLRREIERSAAHAAAVAVQTRRLERVGYDAQVAIDEDATQLHYEDEAGRERVLRAGSAFRLRRTKRRLTPDELIGRLEADPSCVSPGALLRPVVESALLPTVAYVGGPAETSYFAQTGCLFRAFGVMPPIVYPRASFLLVETRIARLLEKLSLEATAVRGNATALVRDRMADTLPRDAADALAGLHTGLAEAWSRVRAAARAIDPTLDVPLRRMEDDAHAQVEAADRKIRQHHHMRQEQLVRQLERVAGYLAPDGVPQERLLNALPFVARHGRALLETIAAAIAIPLGDGDRWPGPECTE
jgi:bacillithiol synthase